MKEKEKNKEKGISELDAQERLARIMNDSPKKMSMSIGNFEIKALKPAVQMLIAEKAVAIQKSEDGNFADLIKHFAQSIPAVVEVLTLAILNDKDKIFKDYDNRTYSDDFRALYDKIMWETDQSEWIECLVNVFDMLSLDFFFDTTNLIGMIRKMTLKRKMTRKEMMKAERQDTSSAEQNGDR